MFSKVVRFSWSDYTVDVKVPFYVSLPRSCSREELVRKCLKYRVLPVLYRVCYDYCVLDDDYYYFDVIPHRIHILPSPLDMVDHVINRSELELMYENVIVHVYNILKHRLYDYAIHFLPTYIDVTCRNKKFHIPLTWLYFDQLKINKTILIDKVELQSLEYDHFIKLCKEYSMQTIMQYYEIVKGYILDLELSQLQKEVLSILNTMACFIDKIEVKYDAYMNILYHYDISKLTVYKDKVKISSYCFLNPVLFLGLNISKLSYLEKLALYNKLVKFLEKINENYHLNFAICEKHIKIIEKLVNNVLRPCINICYRTDYYDIILEISPTNITTLIKTIYKNQIEETKQLLETISKQLNIQLSIKEKTDEPYCYLYYNMEINEDKKYIILLGISNETKTPLTLEKYVETLERILNYLEYALSSTEEKIGILLITDKTYITI